MTRSRARPASLPPTCVAPLMPMSSIFFFFFCGSLLASFFPSKTPVMVHGLTATAPATAPPPRPSSSSSSNNVQSLATVQPFPRTWIPLASTVELDPDRPTPLTFLNQNYVVYRTNSGDWTVLDDACPHRLAPLSEGRIDRVNDVIQCSYHGWSFDGMSGQCRGIPQAAPELESKAMTNAKSCVKSYPVVVEKDIVFAWLWGDDDEAGGAQDGISAAAAGASSSLAVHPERIMEGVPSNCTTYTRDLPYGYTMLVENLLDPSHVPFAHHNLQGKRSDALPINMTTPRNFDEGGFDFYWEDRTMGKMRRGDAEFRAPYLVKYDAKYETGEPGTTRPFQLNILCVPTKPGWSRAIIFAGGGGDGDDDEKANEEKVGMATVTKRGTEPKESKGNKKNTPLVAKIFKLIPTWIAHQFSNKFLDSDLAFLHYQERERSQRNAIGISEYFIPAQSDRCVSGLHKWIGKYGSGAVGDPQQQSSSSSVSVMSGPLPASPASREILFDRYGQHTSHCLPCQNALKGMKKWRRNSYLILALSILGMRHHWIARVAAVVCLALIRIIGSIEPSFKVGDFKHYQND